VTILYLCRKIIVSKGIHVELNVEYMEQKYFSDFVNHKSMVIIEKIFQSPIIVKMYVVFFRWMPLGISFVVRLISYSNTKKQNYFHV